jgi:hypothetical protein
LGCRRRGNNQALGRRQRRMVGIVGLEDDFSPRKGTPLGAVGERHNRTTNGRQGLVLVREEAAA